MKRLLLIVLGLGLLIRVAQAADEPAASKPDQKTNQPTDFSKIFKNDKEKLGYAIGMTSAVNLTNSLTRQGIEFDPEFLIKGFRDSVSEGGKPLITEQQEHEILDAGKRDYMAKMQEKRKQAMEKAKVEGEKNKKDGEAFLAAKKGEPGVIPLPSGLMYKVITEGKGDSPKRLDTVTVNYRGTLIDGTEFDSSAKKGEPVPLQVSGVIPGWTEALLLMKPGAKWQLFIPSNLAYGENGRPPIIGPNATLVFDIELVSVKPGPTPPPTPPASANTASPLTSDIIKVPSAEELKKGAKIETIKPEDIEKERAKEAAKTNQ